VPLDDGAYRTAAARRHLANIEERVLPAVTVLPYNVEIARVCGGLQARLMDVGRPIADADAQIAATAIAHGLRLVTGNLHHFERIEGLTIEPALMEARARG
jgi:predicted nucleic acid-binding protein